MTPFPVIAGGDGRDGPPMPDDGTAIVVDPDDGTAYLWDDWVYHGTYDLGPNALELVGGIVLLGVES